MTDVKIRGNTYCPTTVRWMPREAIDVQGDGRPIYGAVRQVQLRWELTSYEEWASLQRVYDDVRASGTAVVQLPGFPTTTGTSLSYVEYSGCVLGEPQIGNFFAESYPESIVLIISNIVTD